MPALHKLQVLQKSQSVKVLPLQKSVCLGGMCLGLRLVWCMCVCVCVCVCVCICESPGIAVFSSIGDRWIDRQVGVTPNRTGVIEMSLAKGKGILSGPSGVSTDGTR